MVRKSKYSKEIKIKAFNSLIENKEEIITGYEVILEEPLDTTKLEKKTANIQNEDEALWTFTIDKVVIEDNIILRLLLLYFRKVGSIYVEKL